MRVGNGDKVNVVCDSWLSSAPNYKIYVDIDSRWYGLKVSDLLLDGARNVELIFSLFPPNIVDHILQIPVVLYRGEDWQIWACSTNGIFTVKSAYYVARDLLDKPCPDRSSRNSVWLLTWKSMMRPHVINFIWKVVHGIVHCSAALILKGVDCDIMCNVCGEHEETQEHLLLHCRIAREVLNDLCPTVVSYIMAQQEPFTWLDVLNFAATGGVLVVFGYSLWLIWKNRNDACFNLFSSMKVRYLVAELDVSSNASSIYDIPPQELTTDELFGSSHT